MPHPIRTLFNEIAPTYDVLNHLFSLNIDRWWRHKALRAIEIPSQAMILDICTGTADVAIAAAKAYPGSHIYGVDFSGQMLQYGQKKIYRQQLHTNIALLHADALHLPFPSHSFHAAFLSFGLRNLTDRPQGIQEMIRVLQPGGNLVILEFAPPPNSFFGRMFRFYLVQVMSRVGGVVSKSPGAYRYLHTSIEQFPEPQAILALLRRAGLDTVHYKPMTCKMVYVYAARKAATT